jgi:hypothetical protein
LIVLIANITKAGSIISGKTVYKRNPACFKLLLRNVKLLLNGMEQNLYPTNLFTLNPSIPPLPGERG